MSNRLIDILDDEKKIDGVNANYQYNQSVIPRLKKLIKFIDVSTNDYGFVHDLIYDLKESPHHRVTSLEMKKCNELWKKYK